MESLLSSFSNYFNGSCTNTPKTIEINNAIIADIKICNKYSKIVQFDSFFCSTIVQFDNIPESFWISVLLHPDQYKIGDTVSFNYQPGVGMPVIKYMTISKNRKLINSEIINETFDCGKKINELSSQINKITKDMSKNLLNQLYNPGKLNKITDEYELLKKKKADLEQQRDQYITNFEDRISVYKEGWTQF